MEVPRVLKPSSSGVSKRPGLTANIFRDSVIDIYVFFGKKFKYKVHREIICDSSLFFRRACKRGGRRVEVSFCSPILFDEYLEWLYFNRLSATSQFLLLKLYLLGHDLGDHDFKTVCLSASFQSFRARGKDLGSVTVHDAARLYHRLSRSDPLCQLFVSAWAYWGDASWFAAEDEDEDGGEHDTAKQEFLRDVLLAKAELLDSCKDPQRFEDRMPQLEDLSNVEVDDSEA